MKRALASVLAALACAQCTKLPTGPSEFLGAGGLLVQVTTTGSAVDAGGYVVTVDGDGALTRGVAPTGSVAFQSLAAGPHVVALTDVAANCYVAGDNPRTVTVVEGGFVQVSFAVACVDGPIPPGTGSVVVEVTTTGDPVDADGYTVTVHGDPAWSEAAGPNDSVRFDGLSPGGHSVELSGIAPDCEVSGHNPRMVTVVAGAEARMSFSVTCGGDPPDATGWLLVQVTTTGSRVDADGYTVTVHGDSTWSQAVGPNGSVAFPHLPVGEHLVALSGVATNCRPEPGPILFTVEEGAVAQVEFAIECVGPSGLLVQATTTGSAVDADGYTVTVDGDPALAQSVGPNSSVAFDGLSAGEHMLELSGVAANCTVAGSNPPRGHGRGGRDSPRSVLRYMCGRGLPDRAGDHRGQRDRHRRLPRHRGRRRSVAPVRRAQRLRPLRRSRSR